MSRTFWLALVIGLCSPAVACSTPAPKTNEDAKAEPQPEPAPPDERPDLKALVSRELDALPLVAASDPKGAWSFQVEAKNLSQKAHAGSQEIVIDLGTTQPLGCFVYDHGIDVGGTLAKLIGSTGREVEYQVIAPVAAVPIGDTPAFMMDAVYLAKTKDGQALGELKIGIYGAPISPVLCLHDEPGYRSSFARIFTSLLKSFKRSTTPPPARFVELHLAHVEDVPVGYYRRAVYGNGDDQSMHHWGVMLYAPSPRELRFEDSQTVLELDKTGRVKKGLWIKALNGDLTTRLEIVREAGNRYKFAGTHQGKSISGNFQSKDKKGLLSEIGVADVLRKLKPAQKKLEIEEYHPGLDAQKPVTVSYGRDAGDPSKFLLTVNDGEMTAVIDEQGLFKRIEAGTGKAVMVSERVMSTGKL